MKFNTKAIHGGQQNDPLTGAVMTPIYQVSTYGQTSPSVHKGYEYSRAGNPTRTALGKSIASLENGTHGFAFSSGLAATDSVIKLLDPGDQVIACDDLYGGSYRMFSKIFSKYGIKFHFVDMANEQVVRKKINSKTKMIWVETPTNPLMKIFDLNLLATIAKSSGLLFAVDNTFASPYLQNPLDLGADIVMHSGTKYLAGHSDVIIGLLVVKEQQLAERLGFNLFAGGAVAGPQDCFLTLRGIKTLHIRMQRQCENAKEIVKFLQAHKKVGKVYYPGLESHPGHVIAKKQMNDFGGMISFDFANHSKASTIAFLENLRVMTLAESLGGVESLANHPASMTHASIPIEVRKSIGILDDLVRLSIGIEDVNDLMNDLDEALKFA